MLKHSIESLGCHLEALVGIAHSHLLRVNSMVRRVDKGEVVL